MRGVHPWRVICILLTYGPEFGDFVGRILCDVHQFLHSIPYQLYALIVQSALVGFIICSVFFEITLCTFNIYN
jgi:hypothetical protein